MSARTVTTVFCPPVPPGAVGIQIMAFTRVARVRSVCGLIVSCSAVQYSEYALFGVTMCVLGLVDESSTLFTWLGAARPSAEVGAWRRLPWGVSLLGVLLSTRLTELVSLVPVFSARALP